MTTQAPETRSVRTHGSMLDIPVPLPPHFDRSPGFELMRREHDGILSERAEGRHPVLVTTRGFPVEFAYRVETIWTFELGAST